jgi:uncharacterized membrane protein (UPF0127 family)
MDRRRFLTLALALAVAVPGARGAEPFATSSLSLVTAKGRFRFTVEMAVDGPQRTQGLQNRQTLAAHVGMLFDYGRTQKVAMWMKNTLVPLDMLFISADGRVVNIAADTVPGSLTSIPSSGPVRAVLEINAGTSSRLGIVPGDRVIHPIFRN